MKLKLTNLVFSFIASLLLICISKYVFGVRSFIELIGTFILALILTIPIYYFCFGSSKK